MNQELLLSTLSQAPADEVKLLAEDLIPHLEPIEVLRNRSGLVMLPAAEPVQQATFYLGEALVSEALVQAAGVEGYGACLGRDIELALAIALIDAARAAEIADQRIAAYLSEAAGRQAEAYQRLLAQVAATRAELETF